MIDMFALLVSLGMTAIVVFFAIRFNREREWFERPGEVRKPPPPRPSRFATGRLAPGRAATARPPTALPPGRAPERVPRR